MKKKKTNLLILNCFVDIDENRYNLIGKIARFVIEDLNIKTKIIININSLDEMDDNFGSCCSINEIDISNEDDFGDLFKTIAHELRHIWQKQNKLLTNNNEWFGKIYECDYNNLPWEVDACNYEERIYKKWNLENT